MKWKLKRGTWRPKLLDYAKAVLDENIRRASRSAFSILKEISNKDDEDFTRQIKAALEPLVNIKVQAMLTYCT